MPRLSIIIPALRSSARLETTLVSVLENRPPDCEIIVVHDMSYADPYELAGEVRFLQVPRGAGLNAALNEGIAASQAPVVHMLLAGLEVTDGWIERPLAEFDDARVASVAPLLVDALDAHKPIAAGLDYCCRRGRIVRVDCASRGESGTVSVQMEPAEVLGPLVQAAFYRRSALELAGGIPNNMEDCADADLAMSLRFAGYRSIFEPQSVILGSPADIAAPPAGFRHGLVSERLFWRSAPVAGWFRSMVGHPIGVLIAFLRSMPRPGAFTSLLGRSVATFHMRSHRAHHHWLIDLRRTATALFQGLRPQRIRIDQAHEVSRPAPTRDTQIAAHST